METVIEAVNTTAMETREAAIAEWVKAIVVNSTESLLRCEQFILAIDADIKEVEAEFKLGIGKAFELHRHLTGQRSKHVEPRKAAKAAAKEKCRTYRRLVEDERRAEEARLRAIALKEEEDRRLAEVEQLAEAGHEEAAEEALNRPVVPPPVALAPTAPPPPPRMYRESWTAVVNHPELVPRKWLIPDQTALNAYARSLKSKAQGTVPGVTFHDGTGL